MDPRDALPRVLQAVTCTEHLVNFANVVSEIRERINRREDTLIALLDNATGGPITTSSRFDRAAVVARDLGETVAELQQGTPGQMTLVKR